MLRILRLAALAAASLFACALSALPAAAQTASGVPTLGSDSSTYTWCAQTVATGKLGGCTVKYTWNGTAWVVEPADTSGRPQVSVNAASGAFASGSFAAGSMVAGSMVDGANITFGLKADTASCATGQTAMSCWRQMDADIKGPIAAGTNFLGFLGAQAQPSGGGTPSVATTLSTSITSVKSSAGSLYMELCYNPNATVAYVQMFDSATGSVTLGTTAPKLSLPIPATSNGGFGLSAVPVAFGTAISEAATTTPTGSTAPTTALVCNHISN